ALDAHHIRTAVEGSLRRLQTDYIDLYQTHWPDHDYYYEETLQVLDELVEEGKIRYAGCSNETAWGLMKSLWAADKSGLRRFETIQNNFSILCRGFQESLADICQREQVSLLPYSPLAGGVLTGKYNAEVPPAKARFTGYLEGNERSKRIASKYLNSASRAATAELMQLADEVGMSVTTLSVAWSKQFDYVASTIIGATTVEQLEDSLKAADLRLSDEIMRRIDEITEKYPNAVRG
ncbi:MAG: aldo/keto reductase, partial [Leptospiraceae bacterium]|nr:aldo/keto reductase [Leptospiraceae bacterium]